MATVNVALGERSYQVHVENGALDRVGYFAERNRISGKAAIITDSNVCPLYAERLIQSLQDAEYEYSLHVFDAGEQSKNLHTVEELVNEMVAAGHDRSSFVVALGGGVVGDMAGFIASIYYRGIPFIQVPTSVMAHIQEPDITGVLISISGGDQRFDLHPPGLVSGLAPEARLLAVDVQSQAQTAFFFVPGKLDMTTDDFATFCNALLVVVVLKYCNQEPHTLTSMAGNTGSALGRIGEAAVCVDKF